MFMKETLGYFVIFLVVGHLQFLYLYVFFYFIFRSHNLMNTFMSLLFQLLFLWNTMLDELIKGSFVLWNLYLTLNWFNCVGSKIKSKCTSNFFDL